MNRPLVYCTICYITGILSAGYYRNVIMPVIIIISSVFTYIVLISGKRERHVMIPIMALFFAAGFYFYTIYNHVLENKFVRFAGSDITVFGYVSEEARESKNGLVYTVKTSKVIFNNRSYKIKGLLQVNTRLQDESALCYGSTVRVYGVLSLPKGRRNPGGFDYSRYLKCRKISAILNARTIKKNGNRSRFSIKLAALNVRNKIIGVAGKCLPKSEAGLLNGMLIGYREELGEDIEDAFRDAGLTHIMAVSGANVLFIAMPFAVLFKRFGVPRRLSGLIITGILVFFVFITGFSPSVVRAVIMAITMLCAQMLYRETEVITSIAFSALLLLVYNPFLLYDIGFQLSFAATLSLVFLSNPIKKKLDFKFIPGTAVDILVATLAAQLGVLPISTLYFNQISLISIVSNLLVIPLVQVVTILGTIMAVVGQIGLILAKLPAFINYFPLTFIIRVTSFCARFPYAAIKVPTPKLYVVCLYYTVLIFVLIITPKLHLRLRFKHYAALILCIVLITSIGSMLPKKLEVVFIDVGQGDAILISTPAGKNVLIDGGGGADTGNKIVLPLLLDYGIQRLDLIVATHPHGDHLQGLFAIVEQMSVKSIILPDNALVMKDFYEFLELVDNKDVPVSFCQKGNYINLEQDIGLMVLNPDKKRPLTESPANNASLVLKLNYGNTKILLTGDIEKPAEEMLIEGGYDLSSNFLKIPHHGSATSTSSSFLKAVNPDVAIISVGHNNFGHPSKIIEERLKASGCKVYRTDQKGAVRLISDGRTIKVYTTVSNYFPRYAK